jgi:hypothetical protein
MPPYTGRSLLINGEYITIRSLTGHALNLAMWLLPLRLCQRASATVITDRALSVSLDAARGPRAVCLFTQPHGGPASMVAEVASGDPETEVGFYATDWAEGPTQQCQLGRRCAYSSKGPFILRVSSETNASLRLAATFEWAAPLTTPGKCALRMMPEFVKGEFLVADELPGNPSVVCERRKREARLSVGKPGAVAVFVVAAIVVATIAACGEMTRRPFKWLGKQERVTA